MATIHGENNLWGQKIFEGIVVYPVRTGHKQGKLYYVPTELMDDIIYCYRYCVPDGTALELRKHVQSLNFKARL